MNHSQQIQSLATAGVTGAGAVLAQVGAPVEVTWGAIALGLISLASLWIRGYWADRNAAIELRFMVRENAELRGRLSAYERPGPTNHPPIGPTP